MASFRLSAFVTYFGLLLAVQALFHVTSATDVVRFDQSQTSDSDNIYDILEDEQFFIVDQKVSKDRQNPQIPKVFNVSSPKVQQQSVRHERLVDKPAIAVETTTERVRTSPAVHHAGITSNTGAVHDEEIASELLDDYLIFSQDRELIDKMEERRREEEQDLAQRVKRQTVEGTGVSQVQVTITISRAWNPNFADPTTNDFVTLKSSMETALTSQVTNQLPQRPTVEVQAFRQGSIIVEFTVTYPNDDVNRVDLAIQLLVVKNDGLTVNDTTYTVVGEPTITDGTDLDLEKAATCFLCKGYQTCLYNNATPAWFCQASSQDYFPFGELQSDSKLENNRERYSQKLTIPAGIPVVDQTVNEVHVSVNGLLSFGSKYGAFNPRRLPRGNRQLMCGYWADMQLLSADSSSYVYYHAYQRTSSSTAEELAVFTAANNAADLYGDGTGFDASYVLVVTFEEVPPDPTSITTSERVNFQMVLMSDGSVTYGMYIYASGGMQWKEELQRRVVIGYLDVNFPINTARPDTEIGNTNRPGVWFFTIGQLPQPPPEQLCLNWYYDNLPSRNTYNLLSFLLPTCPCSYFLAFRSNTWLPEDNGGALPRCFVTAPFFGQWGKRCCYNTRFGYERNRPLAGSFLLHNPLVNEEQNYINDELPKQHCCEQSDLCTLYYDVRPTDQCQRFFIIIIAVGRGDPHITTLDGKSFAFNAIGEYHLIKIDEPALQFDFQARTCQAKSSTGTPVQASIFCGFVAKGNGTDKFQVELNKNQTGMNIYANGQDLTLLFSSEGNLFNRTFGGLVLRRTNNTLRASFLEGISINITVQFGLLTLEVGVDDTLSGFKGLLGNKNKNPNDDFIFPNGTTLPSDSSERVLLEYGKTWALTAATSIFTYQPGFNTTSYTNDSFVPIFLDEVDQAIRQRAETACGGTTDIGCIYDFIATGDTQLALGTKQAAEEAELAKTIGENQTPLLEGPTRIEVTVGKIKTIPLNATDPDGEEVKYNIISQPATGFYFDNITQTGTWNATNNQTSKLEFLVEDPKGAQSPSLKIEVVLCSGCSGHGNCSFGTYRAQTTGDEYFKQAVCECEPYYEGDDCERDFDACADDPCPLGTNCTDFTIAEHIAAGADSPGYNCTANCPDGYTFNDTALNCYDIDECALNTCNQTCTNIIGSFYCGCDAGYRLVPTTDGSAPTECKDIDECTESTSGCEQVCTNTVGSYVCSCFEGFSLNADNVTCSKDLDPCESLVASGNECEYACKNVSGVPVCQCPKGYTLAANARNCTDIDECSLNLCSQNCNNINGSFTCSCYTGYQLDADKLTCIECPFNKYGDNCNSTCECRGRGTCDKVRGCLCNSGWTGPTCSQDINECVTLVNACPAGQTCVNTNGSYTCNCPTGYRKNATDTTKCYDIDECAVPTLHNCKQICTNTLGAYVCSCRQGYKYNAGTNTCEDIDECAVDSDRCEQSCVNFPGSANCECREGFTLNDDRKTCAKDRNPCEILSDSKNCSYGCEISQSGAATCYCPSGYQLAVDEVTCVDINECENATLNLCTGQCANSPGTFVCSCDVGYKLNNDERNCDACDDYHWGDNCANECNCSPLGTEKCDSITGCVCKEGWLGTLCDLDRNECLTNPCPANAECTDTAGSYRCDCVAGYAFNTAGDTCDDVNECEDNPCDQTCTNTVGSYTCSCSSGFNSVGDTCVDINECLSKPCHQICRNTVGGFACECNPGFLLNTTTRTTCYPQTECTASSCEQGCRVVGGVEECYCFAGYQTNSTNSSACDDIDECANDPCVGGNCTNEPGTFTCTCPSGSKLLADGVTCQTCTQGTYGVDCANNCTCNATNTASCNVDTGACTCNSGWEGPKCSADIDECANATICDGVPNSSCVNSPGSYSCVCNNGSFASAGVCYPCDDSSWGKECSQTCNCVRANTLDCNDTTGDCVCNSFWEGVNCSVDVNECDDNPCNSSLFEVCRNLNGSYACDCQPGYHRPSPTDDCTDLNECLYQNLNTCNRTTEVCSNTAGSFVCNCAAGFTKNANDVCDDVNECTQNTCTQGCTNTFGSFTCSCDPGYTLDADGFTCSDVNECANSNLNNCTAKEDCTNTVGSFVCTCKDGYSRDASGLCIGTYQNFSLTITFGISPAEDLTDRTTAYYISLLNSIQTALRDFFAISIRRPFHSVVVTNMRSGSVIVDAELQIDANDTTNPEGYAAKAAEDLVEAGQLTINGTQETVGEVQYNGTTLPLSNSQCDTFAVFKTCASNEVCAVLNDVPQCSAIQEDETDYRLIIGLGVGIPLFFIVAVVVAVLIYFCCVKRKKEDNRTRAEPSEDRFRSVFASQIPTKGSWGAAHRYQMYSPDTLSEATSDSSGEGQLLKGRRQGRSDFQDSPWYDNRAASVQDGQRGPPRTPRV